MRYAMSAFALLFVSSNAIAQIQSDQPIGNLLQWRSTEGNKIQAYFGTIDRQSEMITLLLPTTIPMSMLSSTSRGNAGQIERELAKQESRSDLLARIKELEATTGALQAKLEAALQKAEKAKTEMPNRSSRPDESRDFLVELNGRGPKKSRPFTITKPTQRAAWSYRSTDGGLFSATIESVSGGPSDLVANEVGDNGQDSTAVYLRPGNYYLDVIAGNCEWEITVSE